VGAYVAYKILDELTEKFESFPDWARKGVWRLLLWLAATGALAAGVIFTVELAVSAASSIQELIAPDGAVSMWFTDSGEVPHWMSTLLAILPVAAFLPATYFASLLDHERIDAQLGWHPSPRQERLVFLTLAAWLAWPFVLPQRFVVTWAPLLGINAAQAGLAVLLILVAVWLVYLVWSYRSLLHQADD
jgi:hypothetical protein